MKIKKHRTAVVKTPWDGAKNLLEAKTPAALMYMHAYFREGADQAGRESYLFPHHEAGEDTPANLQAVNLALTRLCEAKIPESDKLMVMAHLHAHRSDAGLPEQMSEAEIGEAVKHIKKMDDLKADEAKALTELVTLQEKSNLVEWLESRLHMNLTVMADDMFGNGTLTRNERKVLSGAIGAALDSYHDFMKENAPQLFGRRPWEDAPEENGEQDVSESASSALRSAQREVALIESAIALQEKAVRGDGTVPVKIIQPGWGSSGYYPREVLERDGAKAFPKGTKMLWNHPTPVQEADRPEGDLNDLASELVSDARWMERGPKGPGLYADAKVFEAYQEPVNDLAPHIGVSIHARGKGVYGEAEGKQGVIVQEILESPFNRVDYVTMPGAGGEIISLFEAARASTTLRSAQHDKTKSTGAVPDESGAGAVPALEHATDNVANKSMEEEMADEQLKEAVATLQTQNETLATQNARMSVAMAIRDAKDMIREALGSLMSLPDVTKTRLVESLAKNPPMKDGALDRDMFKTAIEEAVKAEVKYLETVLGKGQIRGLGESQDVEEGEEASEKVEESLEASFSALGLSETAAKHAARGRK